MDRRSFLKSGAAAVLSPALPKLPAKPTIKFIGRIHDEFQFEVGPEADFMAIMLKYEEQLIGSILNDMLKIVKGELSE